MSRAKTLLAVLLTALATPLAAGQIPRIAIIIDDLGYELVAGERAIALPGPVACAILPGAPRARQLANAANERGKEVLLQFRIVQEGKRMFGMVFKGKENINLWLVLNGWSYYLLTQGENPFEKEFVQAEKLARKQQAGLWSRKP